ncbi:hypothetical protein EGW08_007701 [Elysia chlorotica]|uniref:Uncharacterized protein n=1 Tax=Elysia chlorotica TaxID=188477 RepID=A0A433TSH4_ELYCH|nr:hypothetical protein EGW08_007701 [Elysia chlorotica]
MAGRQSGLISYTLTGLSSLDGDVSPASSQCHSPPAAETDSAEWGAGRESLLYLSRLSAIRKDKFSILSDSLSLVKTVGEANSKNPKILKILEKIHEIQNNDVFFDVDALSASAREGLLLFAIGQDESYGVAVRSVWSMRRTLAGYSPEAFLRLYLGLCIKDLVHGLSLPPARMREKCESHLRVLDRLRDDGADINALFTVSQKAIFEKAIRESCLHFTSVFEDACEREKILVDYETSDFGPRLSTSLRTLAKVLFPKSAQPTWQVSAEDKLARIFFPKSAQPTWQVSAEDKLARIFFPKSAQPKWQVSELRTN